MCVFIRNQASDHPDVGVHVLALRWFSFVNIQQWSIRCLYAPRLQPAAGAAAEPDGVCCVFAPAAAVAFVVMDDALVAVLQQVWCMHDGLLLLM